MHLDSLVKTAFYAELCLREEIIMAGTKLVECIIWHLTKNSYRGKKVYIGEKNENGCFFNISSTMVMVSLYSAIHEQSFSLIMPQCAHAQGMHM